MRGKYSPTVSYSYATDQEWHEKSRRARAALAGADCLLDLQGYDSYGYDVQGLDRAGHSEADYIADENLFERVWLDYGGIVIP